MLAHFQARNVAKTGAVYLISWHVRVEICFGVGELAVKGVLKLIALVLTGIVHVVSTFLLK